MGWEDRHLHAFAIDGIIFGDPQDDEDGERGTLDEARFKLRQVFHKEGQHIRTEYDFGDDWEHTLEVEKISTPQKTRAIHFV